MVLVLKVLCYIIVNGQWHRLMVSCCSGVRLCGCKFHLFHLLAV